MKNTPEIYLIGQRIKRKILMITILISVLLGVIIGNACQSLIFGLFLSVVLAFFQIIMTKKYYWIISNQGIYTPLNFGIKKYLIIMLKYLLCGDDTGNIVFVNYRTIAYLNLFEKKGKLRIQIIQKNGDFISIDPKTTITDSGFIKSRHIDDKISVSIIFTVFKYLLENNKKPNYNIKFIISTYEEIGHGAAHLPNSIDRMIAVDMGCIGKDLSCTEYDVSICAKDSSGPYDYQMVSELIELSKKYDLGYAVDVYPFYGSDASAALRAGHDIQAALIGPGVHASHGVERTHIDGCTNTMKLLHAYLTEIKF